MGRCRANFPYAPQAADELPLQEGDIVDVIAMVRCGLGCCHLGFLSKSHLHVASKLQLDDVWWEGLLRGTRGIFPAQYVEMLPQ